MWTGGKAPGGRGGCAGGTTVTTDIKSRSSRASRTRRALPLWREESVEEVVRANEPENLVKFNIVKLPLNEVGDCSALVFGDPSGILISPAVDLSLYL
jgi:hypothetical protein